MKQKVFAIGIILLFIGMSIIPSTAQDTTNPLQTSNGKWWYVGGSGLGNYSKIQDAIDNATYGDIVFVFRGIYYENVWINKSVTLIGENKEMTILDGKKLGDVVTILSDDVTLDGLTICDSINNEWEHWAIKVDKRSSSLHHLRFSDCSIIHNAGGILLKNVTDCTISNCSISNNSYTSIAIRSHANNLFIDNTTIYKNGRKIDNNSGYIGGIVFEPSDFIRTNIMIKHCTISRNFGEGIQIGIVQNLSVDSSLIENNSWHGLHLIDASNISIGHSLIHNNNWAGICIDRRLHNIMIQDNIIADNKRQGIYFNGPEKIDVICIRQNIILHNGGNAQQVHMIDGGIIVVLCENDVSIFNNTIESNIGYGVFFVYSRNNQVIGNNFINNTHHASFSYYSLWNKWSANYWDDWSGVGPKVIKGKFKDSFVPWMNCDWHPAKESYDIPIMC